MTAHLKRKNGHLLRRNGHLSKCCCSANTDCTGCSDCLPADLASTFYWKFHFRRFSGTPCVVGTDPQCDLDVVVPMVRNAAVLAGLPGAACTWYGDAQGWQATLWFNIFTPCGWWGSVIPGSDTAARCATAWNIHPFSPVGGGDNPCSPVCTFPDQIFDYCAEFGYWESATNNRIEAAA